jgi:hypothetical protein
VEEEEGKNNANFRFQAYVSGIGHREVKPAINYKMAHV